jgi:chromosome segregation protein
MQSFTLRFGFGRPVSNRRETTLLKLKKLQILGFKSFCDRTELKFHGEGIAAIVGPNGCGKSNIADAIAWVLGEQSAKTLRGSRMEDVIFAGSRERKPTGMAEVSLTLVDPQVYDGPIAVEPQVEVHDEMPAEDWDEAAVRSASEAEAEKYIEEVQPGPEEVRVEAGSAPADGTNEVAVEGAIQPGEGRTTSQTEGAPAEEGGAVTGAAAPLQDHEHRVDAGDSPVQPAEVASDASTQTAGETPAPQEAHAAVVGPPAVVLKIRRRSFKTREFKKGEIVVTRRLFRTGDSEYLLNGKLCRLRDIQDIFMGTGLGPESYAIIEQGRIGQILSSKPHDRRAIIEEAARITKFKTRKRLAEARLEQAKLNLSRVNDIFDEVTRQMNSLKRQANKAERYAKLRDEMRGKLRIVVSSKFAQQVAERAMREAQVADLNADIEARTQSVQQLDVEHGETTQRGYALEAESRRNAERRSEIAMEIDRATRRRTTNEERCAELAARTVAAEAELAQTTVQLESLERERAENRGVVESAAADVAAAQAELERGQQDAASAAAALASTEQQVEQQRLQAIQTMNAAAGVRNQIIQAEERAAALDREANRLRQEIAVAEQEIDSFGGKRGQLQIDYTSASEQVSTLAQQIAETRRSLEQKRGDEGESKRRLDTLRAEYANALGRKGSLEAVIAEHGYSTESVRRLFQSGALQGGAAPAGVLADFLEVDQKYEHVVEDFMRDELNYVVVKSWDAADQGLQLLRSDVDGRATFLVHPSDSQAKFPFTVDEARHTPASDTVTPVARCIRVLNGFGKSLEAILPKLRDGYLVPEPGAARNLALENPEGFFLAANGECFHNVTVTGGKQRSEGPLSMKRELRDIIRLIGEIEDSLRSQEARVGVLGKEIVALAALLDRLEQERLEGEKSALTAGHSLRQLEQEMGRASDRVQTYHSELSRVTREHEQTQDVLSDKRAELAGCEARAAEAEQTMAAAQEQIVALKSARDASSQTAAGLQARVAALEERRIASAAALQRIETLATEVGSRVNVLRGQIDSSIAERQQRESENAQLAEQLVALVAEREEVEARAAELQVESERVRERLAAIEEELRAARQALDEARDRRGELAAALAKLQSDSEYLVQTCVADLGVTPEQILAEGVAPLEGEALALEDTAYQEMRTRLEAMGQVNMLALEEYKETAERHSFLETQRKDLLDAIADTQNTIKEIDVVSRQKFEEAFEKINENFTATFKKLFGGGHAFMKLTDLENSNESGIDVVASPPGKRLQNVLLLSGGEKALTALSLLVGIFQYQPSPFCILDEVDAPLDETNVGRFTELVRDMSVQTQFIIITHSKKTMSISPVMYGVTMQEPGVSKVVSVKFHEHPQVVAASA